MCHATDRIRYLYARFRTRYLWNRVVVWWCVGVVSVVVVGWGGVRVLLYQSDTKYKGPLHGQKNYKCALYTVRLIRFVCCSVKQISRSPTSIAFAPIPYRTCLDCNTGFSSGRLREYTSEYYCCTMVWVVGSGLCLNI